MQTVKKCGATDPERQHVINTHILFDEALIGLIKCNLLMAACERDESSNKQVSQTVKRSAAKYLHYRLSGR